MYRIKLEVRKNATTAQIVWWYCAGADPASNFRGWGQFPQNLVVNLITGSQLQER